MRTRIRARASLYLSASNHSRNGLCPSSAKYSRTSRVCSDPLRPQADVYLFGLRQPIPVIPLPLEPATPEPELPLNMLVHDLYDRARLDLRVDYAAALSPALATIRRVCWKS